MVRVRDLGNASREERAESGVITQSERSFRHKREVWDREMADHVVERGTTAKLGRIEGNLRVGHGAKIEAAERNLVYVTGTAYFEGSAEIRCNFECDSLEGEHRGPREWTET